VSTKLSAILAAHRRDHGRATLRRNLGDAHLFRVNPVFRRIRTFARKNGYSFRSDDTRYAGGPLFSLDRILREKSIPYFDNVTGLAELEAARPGFFRDRDLGVIGPRRNSLFHETSHALCHEVLNLGEASALRRRDAEALLLISLAESAVMITENLASTYAAKSAVGRYLFNANFYVQSPCEADAIVSDLRRKYGVARAFVLLVLAHTFGWSHAERPARRELSSMLLHSGVGDTAASRKDAALAYCHFFSPRGPIRRNFLMDFYLLSRGYSRRVGEAGYLDYAAALRAHTGIVERLTRLGALVTEGL
jgi:hypothetical protein